MRPGGHPGPPKLIVMAPLRAQLMVYPPPEELADMPRKQTETCIYPNAQAARGAINVSKRHWYSITMGVRTKKGGD